VLAIIVIVSLLQPEPCSPRLERDPGWRTVSVRGLDPGEGCTLTIEALAELIAQELRSDTSHENQQPSSLFLGRLVGYPELGRALLEAADDDVVWHRDRPPPPGEANRWVADTLAASDRPAPLAAALESVGLSATGWSCEKVLVVTLHPSVPKWARGRLGLPYDAMCWIELAPVD